MLLLTAFLLCEAHAMVTLDLSHGKKRMNKYKTKLPQTIQAATSLAMDVSDVDMAVQDEWDMSIYRTFYVGSQ